MSTKSERFQSVINRKISTTTAQFTLLQINNLFMFTYIPYVEITTI